MAPLKLLSDRHPGVMAAGYPWLKCHGSIEAGDVRSGQAFGNARYPWLKCHGSIEALLSAHVMSLPSRLSMAKMPWLH